MSSHTQYHLFFQNLSNTHPFIKWKNKMQVINNTRVKSECKTVFWRVLTNNLYLGECAYNHLTYDNDQCHPARHKYEFCPYCNHNVHSTIEHQIWSCPHISPLWDLVLNSLTQANIPHSIHSFSDLFLYIEKGQPS